MSANTHPTPTDPVTDARSVVLSVYALSDVGMSREHNEDAFVVVDLAVGEPMTFDRVQHQLSGDRGMLFMVADGMGGAAAGEIASEMAIEVVRQQVNWRWHEAGSSDPRDFVSALKAATDTANSAIHRYAAEHPDVRGMGTTATIAGLLGDTLYLAQVGDSRAYLVRDGVARQITKDQSLMQKLIEAGEITAEEAELSDRRNIILQALGPESAVKIDLTHQPVRRGDVLVLCSDGLSGLVRPEYIAHVVSEEPELDAVAHRLIDLANEAGGPDNITVVVARFEGGGLEIANHTDEVGHRAFRGPGFETPTTPLSLEAVDYETQDTPTDPHILLDVSATAPTEEVPVLDAEDGPPPVAGPESMLPLIPAAKPERRPRGRLYLSLLAAAGLALAGYLAWRWWPFTR